MTSLIRPPELSYERVSPCANCNKEGAQSKCGKCQYKWYCGRECQVKDYKKHKGSCTTLKSNIDLMRYHKEDVERCMQVYEENDRNKVCCPLCKQYKCNNEAGKIQLKCHHIFCISCLQALRVFHCPICAQYGSATSASSFRDLLGRMLQLFHVIETLPEDSEQRQQIIHFTRLENTRIKSWSEFATRNMEKEDVFGYRLYDLKLFVFEKRYQKAISLAQELLLIDPQSSAAVDASNILTDSVTMDVGKFYVLALEGIGEYQTAITFLLPLLVEIPYLTLSMATNSHNKGGETELAGHSCMIYSHLGYCYSQLYEREEGEEGKALKAIDYGETACFLSLRMMTTSNWIAYEYLAKVYAKRDEKEKARRTLMKGIRHQNPASDVVTAKLKLLLNEMKED